MILGRTMGKGTVDRTTDVTDVMDVEYILESLGSRSVENCLTLSAYTW
jgi:hypothetical protein